jgi:L-2-hydroxyglutarate oxidase LhgO
VAALARGKEYNFWEVLKSEFPKFQTKSLIGEAQKLVPSIGSNKNWKKLPAGVRAQLVNLETGKLEQDFIVRKHLNSLHVLNAVSPGWTSALPFGRWLSEKI